MTEETDERPFLGGRVMLRQFRRGHRAGTDACVLAAALDVQPGEHIVDAGAGVGAAAIGLLIRAPGTAAWLVERDDPLCAIADHNIRLNQLANRAKSVNLDLFDREAMSRSGLVGAADVVISNPPFYEVGTLRASPTPRRLSAHVLVGGSHVDWLHAMVRMTKPQGRLCFIHRPDVLALLLRHWPADCGAVQLLPIHSHAERPAVRMLLSTSRGSRAPMSILPPLVLHGSGGTFTVEADAIHRGIGAPLMRRAGLRPAPAGSAQ